jgi:hypothetical protein
MRLASASLAPEPAERDLHEPLDGAKPRIDVDIVDAVTRTALGKGPLVRALRRE